jgi:glucose-6-phosphate-specific signal transduction histidine kinase
MRVMARSDFVRVLGIIAVIIGISLVHYLTPDSMLQLHYLIQRLFYVPVVYAGLYYGWRGGLAAAVLAALAYLPRLWRHRGCIRVTRSISTRKWSCSV